MAMLPFCGYNMADYFAHWMKIGGRLKNPPKMFFVNWFKKDKEGRFIWPGFRDNFRVIKWMMDRVKGVAEARKTPLGLLPNPSDLDFTGLNLSQEVIDTLFEFKKDDWKREADGIEEFYARFDGRIPREMVEHLAKLRQSLV